MSKFSLGCIGAGNMGGAILLGLKACDMVKLRANDIDKTKVDALNAGQGGGLVEWADSPEALARDSDIVLLAVKPQQMEEAAKQIRSVLTAQKIVVSLAAGIELETVRELTGAVCPVVRLMPNLPALVGKGVFALCLDDPKLSGEQRTLLTDLFKLLGRVSVLPQAKFPAFTALVGCGPAYAFLFMEGLLNAAITMGFSAGEAKALICATVEGSARMASDSRDSLADLRMLVSSPAGMTIYAVNEMERKAVRGNVADAVLQAWERDARLSGK